MKKFVTIFLLMIISATSFAQDKKGQISIETGGGTYFYIFYNNVKRHSIYQHSYFNVKEYYSNRWNHEQNISLNYYITDHVKVGIGVGSFTKYVNNHTNDYYRSIQYNQRFTRMPFFTISYENDITNSIGLGVFAQCGAVQIRQYSVELYDPNDNENFRYYYIFDLNKKSNNKPYTSYSSYRVGLNLYFSLSNSFRLNCKPYYNFLYAKDISYNKNKKTTAFGRYYLDETYVKNHPLPIGDQGGMSSFGFNIGLEYFIHPTLKRKHVKDENSTDTNPWSISLKTGALKYMLNKSDEYKESKKFSNRFNYERYLILSKYINKYSKIGLGIGTATRDINLDSIYTQTPQVEYTITYLKLPIVIDGFYDLCKWFRIGATGMFSFDFITKSNLLLKNIPESFYYPSYYSIIYRTKSPSGLHCSYKLGLDLTLKINKNWNFIISPSYNRIITTFEDDWKTENAQHGMTNCYFPDDPYEADLINQYKTKLPNGENGGLSAFSLGIGLEYKF